MTAAYIMARQGELYHTKGFDNRMTEFSPLPAAEELYHTKSY